MSNSKELLNAYNVEEKLRAEIKRLRGVLSDISESRPDKFMDVDKTPELVQWICDTCSLARRERYPAPKEHALDQLLHPKNNE